MQKDINYLFDILIDSGRAKNDAGLGRLLKVGPSVISRLRSHKIEPGAVIILALVELGNIPMADVRAVIPRKGDASE